MITNIQRKPLAKDSFYREGKVRCELWDTEIAVELFDEEVTLEYAERCATVQYPLYQHQDFHHWFQDLP